MIRLLNISHFVLIFCSILTLLHGPKASALGIAGLIDEFVPPGASTRTLKEIAGNPKFQARLIGEISGKVGSQITADVLRNSLRLKLFEFVSQAKNVTWTQSDLTSLMENLLKSNCSANVSCQIAFNMRNKDIAPFLSELAQTIRKQADAKIASYQVKEEEMISEILKLKEGSPEYLRKQEEFMKLRDEEMPFYELTQVADKLDHESGFPFLDNLLISCKQ